MILQQSLFTLHEFQITMVQSQINQKIRSHRTKSHEEEQEFPLKRNTKQYKTPNQHTPFFVVVELSPYQMTPPKTQRLQRHVIC